MSSGTNRNTHLTVDGINIHRPSAKFLRLSQLRKLLECEQVAAVCYRIRSNRIEFLLVQTRGGRWTFPKGHAEPGLTHAQAAALEAFEEAGVHGRMEESSFGRYVRRKGGNTRDSTARTAEKELSVNAYLCEVLWLEPPRESNRNPTWFSAEKAKRRLREARVPHYAEELAHVVDRAIPHIQQLHDRDRAVAQRMRLRGNQKDALQKVQFTIEHSKEAIREAGILLPKPKKRNKVVQIDQF